MSRAVGSIFLDMNVNKKSFDKQVGGMGSSITKTLGPIIGKIGLALGAAAGAASLVSFSASCVKLGSDLAEVQNVVDTTFPNMASKVNEFASTAIDRIGLSETVTKKYMGVMGAMSKSFGFSENAAYGMAEAVTTLAGDVASFYNLSSDEAYTKLKSIWTGETESLKELGVVMTQAALDQFALANGYGKTTAKMSEQEKLSLRYAFVLNKLSTASGDFQRTQGGWANQTRVLQLRFEQLKATIGQGLINAFLPVVRTMNTLLGKIQEVANAFNALSAKVFGKAQTAAGTTAKTVAEIGDATSGAIDGIAGASDAAKKAASNTASIDELNIVQPDDASGSSGGMASGVGDVGTQADKVTGTLETGMVKSLDKVHKLILDISKSFKTGILDQINKADFSGVLDGLGKIKTSLLNIVSDNDVANSAARFLTSYAGAIGSNIGTMLTIGTNIASNVTQGIGNYLSGNTEFIKQKLSNMFETGVDFSQTTIKLNTFLSDISTILTGPTAVGITTNLVTVFSNGLLNIVDLLSRFGTDLYDLLVTPITNNSSAIKTAIEGTLGPLKTLTDGIVDATEKAWVHIFETYNTYVAPAMESIKTSISSVVEKFLEFYNTYISPILDRLAEKFTTVINEHVGPAFDAMVTAIGKVSEVIALFWETVLVPVFGWIVDNIGPIIAPIFESFGNTIAVVFGAIGDVLKLFWDGLGALMDFIKNVLKGDWEAAWKSIGDFGKEVWTTLKSTIGDILGQIYENINTKLNFIQSIFNTIFTAIKDSVSKTFGELWTNIKGIINSIIGGVEGMANGVVRGINKVINALNSLELDVPDWVTDLTGIKGFGFNIPTLGEVSIPRLAQGGYAKANSPRLAMIGDNRLQGEIVAPEDKMQQMALSAAKLASQDNMSSDLLMMVIDLLREIVSLITGLDLTTEFDGRALLLMLKNQTGRSGLPDLIS